MLPTGRSRRATRSSPGPRARPFSSAAVTPPAKTASAARPVTTRTVPSTRIRHTMKRNAWAATVASRLKSRRLWPRTARDKLRGEGRACPVNPKGNCISCHMPKVEDPTRRSRFTDHHIRVHRDLVTGSLTILSKLPWRCQSEISQDRRESPQECASAAADFRDQRAGNGRGQEPDRARRTRVSLENLLMIVSVVALGAGAVYSYQQYRVSRLAQLVRSSFAAAQIRECTRAAKRWLQRQPGSAEAHYYKAWDRWQGTSREKRSRLSIEPESWVSTRSGLIA